MENEPLQTRPRQSFFLTIEGYRKALEIWRRTHGTLRLRNLKPETFYGLDRLFAEGRKTSQLARSRRIGIEQLLDALFDPDNADVLLRLISQGAAELPGDWAAVPCGQEGPGARDQGPGREGVLAQRRGDAEEAAGGTSD